MIKSLKMSTVSLELCAFVEAKLSNRLEDTSLLKISESKDLDLTLDTSRSLLSFFNQSDD